MARLWTPGALERIPTLHAAIGLNAVALSTAGVLLAAPGAGLFIAIMGLVLYGEKTFYVRDDTPGNVMGGSTAPFPAASTLTLPIGREPWSILPANKALEVFNQDGAATSDFAGVLAYKILDEAAGA